MEASRARGNRDNPRLRLCLGLTSVRHMVDRLEAECTQAATSSSGLEVIKYDPDVDNTYIVYNDLPFKEPTGQVLNKFVANFAVALSRCIPSVTFANFGVLSIATAVFAPRMISYLVLYPFCRLVFGTLYPAYASYKAVRTKNLKEYVKWMMYWIVFALFTCTETFTDVFLSWFPFYYEVKIVLVLWLLSPATKGSSILYRKFVHPALCRREQEIDEYIAKAKDQGYHTVLNLGTKGVNYATTVIMQTAIKGGGGLVQQLRKSYSLSDLSECEPRDERAVAADEASDVLAEPRLIRRAIKSGFAARRSASESNSRQPMYFPEVDVDVRSTRSNRMDEPDFSHIKSSEDISSGYSSADNSASLTRTGSVGAAGAAGRARARASRTTTITTIKRPQAAEDNEVLIEEVQEDDPHNYTNMPSLVNVSSCLYLSHTNPPFIYQYIGDQVKIIQVLGQYPLSDETNVKSDKNEQNTIASEDVDKPENNLDQTDTSQLEFGKDEKVENIITLENNFVEETRPNILPKVTGNNIANNDEKDIASIKKNVNNEIECPLNEPNYLIINTSAESLTDNYTTDDEAFFGTPTDSPRLHKKSQKGKYGKNKAPLPPTTDTICLIQNVENVDSDKSINRLKTESQEIKKDDELANNSDVLSSLDEKRDQKSKSPLRIVKSSGIGFGKILQFPSKLAFWHKVDNKQIPDCSSCFDEKNKSASTENISGNFQNKDAVSSTAEATNDIIDIPLRKRSDDEMSFEDAQETENEVTSQDIIEKSDVLQKLIVAKIESHPEYKYRPYESEIPTPSKTTDL